MLGRENTKLGAQVMHIIVLMAEYRKERIN